MNWVVGQKKISLYFPYNACRDVILEGNNRGLPFPDICQYITMEL